LAKVLGHELYADEGLRKFEELVSRVIDAYLRSGTDDIAVTFAPDFGVIGIYIPVREEIEQDGRLVVEEREHPEFSVFVETSNVDQRGRTAVVARCRRVIEEALARLAREVESAIRRELPPHIASAVRIECRFTVDRAVCRAVDAISGEPIAESDFVQSTHTLAIPSLEYWTSFARTRIACLLERELSRILHYFSKRPALARVLIDRLRAAIEPEPRRAELSI